jgi:hypothetical protein
LNDYTLGALEALSYAKAVLDKRFPEEDKGPILDAYQELEEVQLKLLGGCAWSFKAKVNLTKTEI